MLSPVLRIVIKVVEEIKPAENNSSVNFTEYLTLL